MSHEITKNDSVVIAQHDQSRLDLAWHGMGIPISTGQTPTELVAKFDNLACTIDQLPLYAKKEDGSFIAVDSHVANVRNDTDDIMGVVGHTYQVVQNIDLAKFSEALATTDERVQVETAGTIRGGKRVWFLCKSSSYEIGTGRNASDVVSPYLLVANGHDGGLSIRVQPTTIRVVCSNTLHMVVPNDSNTENRETCISLKHTSNVMDRLEEAKACLQQFNVLRERNIAMANTLASKSVTKETVNQFFLDAYQEDIGLIPVDSDDLNRGDKSKRSRALSAFNSFTTRWDDEEDAYGANVWTLLNAYTGLIQHDAKARGKDDEDRIESRISSNLFGLNSQRTQRALNQAMSMVS